MAPAAEQRPKRLVSVRVEMDEELHEAIRRQADKEDRTMASLIRNAMRERASGYLNGAG